MLNQFYNYLATLLINYFKDVGIKSGERFYLQLDNEKDVENLVSSLKQIGYGIDFSYKHELGETYNTFYIPLKYTNIVIANTSHDVKPDFLVTLRNLVGAQTGLWEDKALLSIVSEQLDSIQGGSSDLQKEGMPLHPLSIFNHLKDEIEKSKLQNVEKIILIDNLESLMDEQYFQQITLFDFEEIFSSLQKGFIDDKEYYKFGIFKDPDLDTFRGKEQKERLKKNREFFEFVKKVHDYGLEQSELESMFSTEGSKQLMDKNWKDQLFTKVKKFHEDYLKTNKKNKVNYVELQISNKYKYWDKPLNEKSSGKRKRHIIIFNSSKDKTIEFQLYFQLEGEIRSLDTQYFEAKNAKTKNFDYEVKRNNIRIKFHCEDNRVLFQKFSYKHESKSSLGAEFFIAIFPLDPLLLDPFMSKYNVNPTKEAIEISFDENDIKFGDGIDKKVIEISDNNQSIPISDDETLIISPLPEAFNDNDELKIHLIKDNLDIPIILKNEIPNSTPITGQRIYKIIRESGKDFLWIRENDRLIIENREYYFHNEYKEFFYWEDQFIRDGLKSAIFESDLLIPVEVKLSDDLREAYSRFINYFRLNNSIPSISTITEELRNRALDYLKAFQKEIMAFEDGIPVGSKGRDLFKLGIVKTNGLIYFSPFHPLMVAYKLKLFEMLKNEEIDNSILYRLSPESLIPFIYDENDSLYRPEHQKAVMDWMVFKPIQKVSVSDANLYLSKVVYDKLSQFKEHFAYLFMPSSLAPFKINVINITNDKEVLKGIINWLKNEILKHGFENLKPVEVTLYNEDVYESTFELYSQVETVEEFERLFDLKLKVNDYEADDILRIIRGNLLFYKGNLEEEFKYAHISFYKMQVQEKHAIQPMKDMKTGISIDGLYSSVPSMKDEETYKSGFGIKEYKIDERDYLVGISYYLNELVANLRNGGNDSYRRGEAILSRTTTTDENVLKNIFKSSYWVTFVDPAIDLDFFNKFDDNLVVIHYSDQYSSSSRYDAITVTDKSEQYFSVIREFLKTKEISGNEENVINTVKAFNTFNGEWLLRIIGSKGYYGREKLSIISAIKYSLSYLDHPNILWVPISLEEILRVAGAVSLNKSEGIFTAKNLNVKGAHSDDLLLIGLEKKNDIIYIHFYPVEVKIGINSGEVLQKARVQVRKTKSLLLSTLTSTDNDTFSSLFYRNFFIQLFISNAHKIYQSKLWEEKEYNLSDETIGKLLKDQYQISNHLKDYIGEGAIISFRKEAFHRSAKLEEDVLLINLTERDGYEGLTSSIEGIRNWVQNQQNDFIKEEMLSYNYQKHHNNIDNTPDEKSESKIDNTDVSLDINLREGTKENLDIINNNDTLLEEAENIMEGNSTLLLEKKGKNKTERPLETIRIKIGKIDGSNHEIYWEYGNPGLANRHLLISGKSGQGKTYFMQCLLLEKSKLGIPSIVIDYTEGFLPNQLEPEFVSYLGDKLKQKIVYSEKLPINPFKKNIRDIGGIQLPESNTDVAERIKSVFAAVYKSLGIQQQNAIYEAVLKGLEIFGLNMNLTKLKEMLEEDGSSYAKTALSQIRPLIDRNPFRTEDTIDWKDIVSSSGEVFIIQLTGFPRDVQLIITEFILWDLWNYSVRYGTKNKPMPVIMDEAQNLDHTEKSPSARILTEGRKFGWSAWYATQFLKSQLGPDELARLQNSTQKIYFSPPEQELTNIASSLSLEPQEKKYWESKLSSLKKGQCIVHGPILNEKGELSKPTVNVVNISPLSERI